MMNIEISKEKKEFLESIGIDINNLPPEFNRHSDSIKDTFTREEIVFVENERLTGRYQEKFCLKDLVGTIHPDYENRSWLEVFLLSKRGDRIVKEYFKNPEYYSRDLKQFDQTNTRQESPLELYECDGKFFINGGNNRLSLIMMKYMAEISRAQNDEERAKIDNQYTFVADVQPVPKDKDIMYLINMIRDFGNKDIDIRRTSQNASECKYEIRYKEQIIKINSKEDLENYIRSRYDITNLNSLKQLDDVLGKLISDSIMFEVDENRTRIMNNMFPNLQEFKQNFIKLRRLGLDKLFLNGIDLKNINFAELSSSAVALVEKEEQRRQEEEKRKAEEEKRRIKEEQEAEIKREQEANLIKKKYQEQIVANIIKREISNKAENIPNSIETTYWQLKEDEIKFKGLAKKLGLSYSVAETDDLDIYSGINKIRSNIQMIVSQIQGVEKKENLDKALNVFSELEQLAQTTNIGIEHNEMLRDTFAKSFDNKIQDLIRNAKLSKLETEKTQIENEKISIIGRILGKDKLKQAKIENINLKKQLLITEVKENKTYYSLEDSLSELYVYSKCELNKELTPEMKEFLEVVKNDSQLSQMIDQQKVMKQFEGKLKFRQNRGQLIPNDYNKMSNRQQANMLQLQNGDLNRQLQNNRSRNLTKQNRIARITQNNYTVLAKFKDIINEINLSTQIKDNIQQKSEQENQMQL